MGHDVMALRAQELVARLLTDAVENWRQVTTIGATDWHRMAAYELGYAGPTDELVSFFHSEFFVALCDWLDVDANAALARIGLADRDGCLCASCVGEDDGQMLGEL